MKRIMLLLACAMLIAPTFGCRSGGGPFGLFGGNRGSECCGPGAISSGPYTTSYGSDVIYDDEPSMMISPRSTTEILPPRTGR